MQMDHQVFLSLPLLTAIIGQDCWGREKAQLVAVDVRLTRLVQSDEKYESCGLEQERQLELLALKAGTLLRSVRFGYALECAEKLSTLIFEHSSDEIRRIDLQVTLTKGFLAADCGGFRLSCCRDPENIEGGWTRSGEFFIRDLRLQGHVGCEDDQRDEKQILFMSIRIPTSPQYPKIDGQSIVKAAAEVARAHKLVTIEAMAMKIARSIVKDKRLADLVTLNLEKPNVLNFVEAAGVEIVAGINTFD